MSRRVLAVLLLLSGAAALVLEVAWFRRTAQVAGTTSVALSSVLAAVIGGMAVGAFWLGKMADRVARPAALYGRLELGVAAAALASPWLLDGSAPIHAALTRDLADSPALLAAARFSLSALLLAPPAILLGGTLPAAVAALRAPPERVGRDAGFLYAANTLGAVAGTLAAGFLLLPWLGLAWTMRSAAVLSGAAGALALALGRAEREPAPRAYAPVFGHRETRRAIRLSAASGFLGLAAEVAFTRSLVLVFGSTTYAFTVMLAVFLFGIGLGGAIGARLARRSDLALPRLEATVAYTAALFGLGALAVYLLPRLFLQGYLLIGPGFSAGIALRAVLAAFVLLPGAIGLGVAFPLAAHVAAERAAGSGTGRLYAANTLASVAGSTAAVFLLVPALGPQRAVAAVAVAAGGLALFWSRRWALAVPVAVAAAAFLPPPGTAREHLLSGVFHSPDSWLADGRIDDAWADGADVPFFAYGREATVSLHRWYGRMGLHVDGKAVATDHSAADVQHLALLGHLPMLVHPEPRDVLVVGLGMGTTFRAVALHEPRSLQVVEIEAEVVRAARRLGVEPRDVVVGDARMHLRAAPRRYDVITSDPIHPWVRGGGDLYTREYFLSCRDRLTPGGVACQWLPLYQMGLDDVQAVLRTFCSVFRTRAYFAGADLVLVGVAGDSVPAPRDGPPAVTRDLEAIGADSPAALALAEHEALVAAAGGGPVLTDDALTLEFSAAKHLASPEMASVYEWLLELWGEPPEPYASLVAAELAWRRGDGAGWSDLVERALAEAPRDPYVRRSVGEWYLEVSGERLAAGDVNRARRWAHRAARLLEGDPRVLGLRADLHAAAGDDNAAAALYRELLAQQPDNAYLKRRLAHVE